MNEDATITSNEGLVIAFAALGRQLLAECNARERYQEELRETQLAHEYACDEVKRLLDRLDTPAKEEPAASPHVPADLTHRIARTLNAHGVSGDDCLLESLTDLFRDLWKEAHDPN